MEQKTKVVILAAGMGKRMGSSLPKVLLPVGGVPMVLRLIESVEKSGTSEKPVLVIGHGCEAVREMVNSRASFVLQEEQLGTGHALRVAKDALADAKNIVVLYGDHPFVSSDIISDVVTLREQTKTPLAMMTTVVPDWNDWRFAFRHWGRILRNEQGAITGIREWKDATEEERRIKELNPGFYCFDGSWLWENINFLGCENAQGEYYLTDLIHMAVEANHAIASLLISPEQAIGVNTREELDLAEQLVRTNHVLSPKS